MPGPGQVFVLLACRLCKRKTWFSTLRASRISLASAGESELTNQANGTHSRVIKYLINYEPWRIEMYKQ